VQLTVHYQRPAADYATWDLWLWKNLSTGADVDVNKNGVKFTKNDQFGKVATVNVTEMNKFENIGIIVRRGEWLERDVSEDRFISKFNSAGTAEIWLIQGDSTIYYEQPTPTSSQSFAAGQWLVGSQIQPGTYRTSTGGCYWERQKGLGGTTSDIIANGSTASNGGYITILLSDKAFSSRCSWTLDSGSSSSGTSSNNSSTAASGTPVVGRIIANRKWTAFEISNPSKTENITSPSFTVLAATSTGVILIEARNDKFPMIKAGEKIWMYFPGLEPEVITLTKYPRSSNRPTDPNEWPEVVGANISGSNIQFTLINKSKTLRLTGETIYHYFALDSSGNPVFADQLKTYITLLPGGSTLISFPSLIGSTVFSSVVVYIGPVYE
jgi:hypothetical protein